MAVPYRAAYDWVMPTAVLVRTIAQARGIPRPGLLAVAAALAAALLMLSTGFRFGVNDNTYQIPLVLGLAALPQFAHDSFYQNLHWIVSFVWPIERLAATDANLYALFFISYAVALFGLFYALLRIIARFTALNLLSAGLAAVLLGLTYLNSGYAFLSGENIVGGYFTDTQVATALVAVSLALALDDRLVAALAVLGLAFDARTDVALWGLAGLAGASVVMTRDGARLGRAWLIGGAIALVLAAPAAVWWGREIASTGKFADNYRVFLSMVDPNQGLVPTLPLQNWVLFASTLAVGLSAFTVLGPPARAARGAFLGFLAVFAIGCLLPFVTDNQWLLNLRPMGAEAFLQLLAAAAAVAVVVQDVLITGSILRVALSIIIAASILLNRDLLPFAGLAMLARAAFAKGELLGIERRVYDRNPILFGRVAVMSLLVLALLGGLLRVRQPQPWTEPEAMRDPAFAAMVEWARNDTDPTATFLVNGRINSAFDQFQLVARRAVWVDNRRGVSVFWDPRYYPFWIQRIDTLSAMHAPAARLAFSCQAGTDFYADRAAPDFNLNAPAVRPFVVFQNAGFFVIDTKRYCAGR